MAIKENVLPIAQDSGTGYIRTVSSGGVSQRTAFDTVKGAITADMDEAIADEADAREAADDQLQTEIDGKVDKVTGKGLSQNDFTNALKSKLDGIEAGAEVNTIETVKVNGTALVPDENRAVNVPAPTIDDALSDESENAVQNKVITGEISDLKEEINDKPNWTVGSAEQIVSDEASATDTTPYTFRRSGGGLIPFNFTREELSKVVGGTVAWNQLVQEYYANACTTSESGGVITITPSSSSNRYRTQITGTTSIPVIKDHIYFQSVYIKSNGTNSVGFQNYNIEGTRKTTSSSWTYLPQVSKASATQNANFQLMSSDGATPYDIKKDSYMVHDLTAMLGPTIADYLYGLSSADSVATWLDTYFPSMLSETHSYDPGSLQSVCVGAHETTGFNQWDEEWELGTISTDDGSDSASTTQIRSKNYCECLPNAQYYAKGPAMNFAGLRYYDADKNYVGTAYASTVSNAIFTTPNNAAYFRLAFSATYGTTYHNDICINISDATRNGEYQPYQKHTYALDSTKTLRGLFKLDSSNKLYADGDEYDADGSVTRKYGVVDLGTLDWNYVTSYGGFFVTNGISDIIKQSVASTYPPIICSQYAFGGFNETNSYMEELPNKSIIKRLNNEVQVRIKDSDYSTAATFKTAMSGVYLVYELATPTTETADPYTAVQICDSDGTEEFVDALVEAGTRDVAIPAGTETTYFEDMASKLAELPPIPSAPSANGTYTLQAVVSGGSVTYSWTS